jgi:hypothetical protein
MGDSKHLWLQILHQMCGRLLGGELKPPRAHLAAAFDLLLAEI